DGGGGDRVGREVVPLQGSPGQARRERAPQGPPVDGQHVAYSMYTTCMRKGAVVNELTFELVDGQKVAVEVRSALNGGYAGRSQDDVAAHVAELAALGVPAPTTTPCLYPVAPYLVSQADTVPAQHARTSGEAEWAMIVTEDDVLLTVACDHTDRDLE